MEDLFGNMTAHEALSYAWGFLQTYWQGILLTAAVIFFGKKTWGGITGVAGWFTRATVKETLTFGRQICRLMETAPQEWDASGDGWVHQTKGKPTTDNGNISIAIRPGWTRDHVDILWPKHLRLTKSEQREVLDALRGLTIAKAAAEVVAKQESKELTGAWSQDRLALLSEIMKQFQHQSTCQHGAILPTSPAIPKKT